MADCIFCRIVAGDIPARIASRTPDAVVFHDVAPQAPVHLLVVPTRHVGAARDLASDEGEAALGHLLRVAADAARDAGLDAGGYRIVTNTGADGGQSVHHLHLHVLGGRQLHWPPG